MVRGIHKFFHIGPFRIFVRNVSKRSVILYSHTNTAAGTGSPKCIVVPERTDGSNIENYVNGVHEKNVEVSQLQIHDKCKMGIEDIERDVHNG